MTNHGTEEDIRFAIDWVLGLATPPRPSPSAWTDAEWCGYWREQKGRVLHTLNALQFRAVPDAAQVIQRCTDYLVGGGLFNPELMQHGMVRDLIIDCRDALEATLQEPTR